MKEICIKKLSIKLQNGAIETFHAHLLLDTSEGNSEIILKLFLHDVKRYYRIGSYLIKSNEEHLISVDMESVNDKKIKSIKIPSNQFFSVKESSEFYENGTKYQLLFLMEALIEYYLEDYEIQKPGIYQSTFYLSKQSIPLIANDYGYKASDLGKWEAVNRDGKFRKFDEVRYRLIMLFRQKDTFLKNDNLTINREPVLQLRYRLVGLDIPMYTNFLIKLLSFYITEFVDYYYGFYYSKDSKYAHYKVVNNDSIKSKSKRCFHSDYRNVYRFYSSVKKKKEVILDYELIKKFIDKFILASKLDGESKFMLYFSIFEGVRNYFVKKKGSKVKENFNFNGDYNELIKTKIEEISQIVKKSERELFKGSIEGKVNNLKRFPMSEQMNTFLNSKEINVTPNDFELDFKRVLSLRHKIFHGDFVKNNQELKNINSSMPKFTAKFIRLLTKQKDKFDYELEERDFLGSLQNE